MGTDNAASFASIEATVPSQTKQKSPQPGVAVGPRRSNSPDCHSAGPCMLILFCPPVLSEPKCTE